MAGFWTKNCHKNYFSQSNSPLKPHVPQTTNCSDLPKGNSRLTYSLNFPCSTVLLAKLIRFQLAKKFPSFYGTRMFINAFTSACHLSRSWASSIHSIPSRPNSCRYILILSSHLHLGLPSGLFPSGFPTKTRYTPLRSPYMCYTLRLSHSSRFDHQNNIGWGVKIIKLLIM